MNKKTIITILLALVATTGQAQVKCHVEGTLETDVWGDEVIICEAGTDLRVVDEPRFHVKAKDGHFTYDIETDFPRLYVVFFLKQYETSSWFEGKFIAENCNVNVTMYEDKRVRIVSNGEEGRKHAVKDSIEVRMCVSGTPSRKSTISWRTLTAWRSSTKQTSFPLLAKHGL